MLPTGYFIEQFPPGPPDTMHPDPAARAAILENFAEAVQFAAPLPPKLADTVRVLRGFDRPTGEQLRDIGMMAVNLVYFGMNRDGHTTPEPIMAELPPDLSGSELDALSSACDALRSSDPDGRALRVLVWWLDQSQVAA